MVDWKENVKQPWFWIVTGIAALAVTTMLILFNHASGAGASKQEALALKSEVSDLLAKIEKDIQTIVESRLDAESKLNRLEGLMRTPRSPEERNGLGKQLSEQEKRWDMYLEQAEIFHAWGADNSVIEEVRAKLSAAKLAIEDGRNNEAMESLEAAKKIIQPLTHLRGAIEKMQNARAAYSDSKQELEILATTYRIAELPGSRELDTIEKAAAKALERGKVEQAFNQWNSASQRLNDIKGRLLKGLINAYKKAVSKALKARDTAAARRSLNRVKELTRMLDATKKLNTP